jgi:hypothetical protein
VSNFEILRRVTKPISQEQVEDTAHVRYGHIRGTVGSDSPVLATKLASAAQIIVVKRAARAKFAEPL